MNTTTQVTLLQIDNYGPWTVTPEPRPEPDLQSLQSSLYADVSELVGARGGYAFFTRFDNMVAVTNGFDDAGLRRVQETLGNRYPVTVSLTTAVGPTPAAALGDASGRLQAAGSAQDGDRREVFDASVLAADDRTDTDLQVAHFDVNSATEQYTDRMNEFDTFVSIEEGYASLMRYMRAEHDSLSFFVGGDNVIAACSGLSRAEFRAAIDHVDDDADVELKVGVGVGETAVDAGMDAKHALEVCREEGRDVVVDAPAVDAD
jgi:GTP cyclohydrolase IIa